MWVTLHKNTIFKKLYAVLVVLHIKLFIIMCKYHNASIFVNNVFNKHISISPL